jgi:hypothetical protein
MQSARFPPSRWAASLALGLAGAVAARYALHGAGSLITAVFDWAAAAEALRAAVVLAGAGLAVLAAAFALSRLRPPRPARFAAVAAGLALLGGWYAASLEEEVPFPAFFGEYARSPNGRWVDNSPHRPRVAYRTNRFGFRGDDFEVEKRPGTLRVALVGDSFVFGLGVEEHETLKANLDRAFAARGLGKAIEVLNLGVAGNNLGSHAGLCRVALQELDADVVVLGLTLGDDLVPWDQQTEQLDARRLSGMSVLGFLFGRRAAQLTAQGLTTPLTRLAPGLFARAHFERLEALAGAAGGRPLLVASFNDTPWVPALLEGREHLRALPVLPDDPANQIPVDRHFNARGNAVYAELILEALAKLPAVAALEARAPDATASPSAEVADGP